MSYAFTAIQLWAELRERGWNWTDDVDAALPSYRWIPFTRANPDALDMVADLKQKLRADFSLRQLSFAVTMVGAEQRGELDRGTLHLVEAQKDLL